MIRKSIKCLLETHPIGLEQQESTKYSLIVTIIIKYDFYMILYIINASFDLGLYPSVSTLKNRNHSYHYQQSKIKKMLKNVFLNKICYPSHVN